ncbi:MAG TPA: lysophospholipid acyltransferase family protein, partial [Acidimicrobiales bacterium]|nr:lysophospholipid acyltransferase family protein [Acidimicrobiales bacterium]
LAAGLLADGWNLIMFPEGGRSPDGWGRAFRGGAAYLALRCGRPVVPLYLEGTGRLWKRGKRWPKVAAKGEGVHLVFGAPLWPEEGEEGKTRCQRRNLAHSPATARPGAPTSTRRRRPAPMPAARRRQPAP